MNILAFETCFGPLSVCVMRDAEVLFYQELQEPNQQTERLIEFVNKGLVAAGLALSDIDCIATSNGPGSFTGIRIGLACALGLTLGSERRVIAVNSFDAAWEKNGRKDCAVVFRASNIDYYCQKFADSAPADMFAVYSQDVLGYVSDLQMIGNHEDAKYVMPDAKIIASVAMQRIASKEMCYESLEPLYIKPPDAKKKQSA